MKRVKGENSGLDPNEDAPELTKEWFEQAALYRGTKLVRKGKRQAKLKNDPEFDL